MKIEKIKDDLYVQKSLFGWRIVYPIFKEQDKGWKLNNINWKNLLIGSWVNLITVLLIVLIICGLTFSYLHDTELCRKVIENPCEYSYRLTGLGNDNINVSETDWSNILGVDNEGDISVNK